MNDTLYSKRKVNMMRINALRKEGSIAKLYFLKYLAGAHEFDFDTLSAKNYHYEVYFIKKISENTPSLSLLHGNINTYRGAQILKILGTSVDNKKLKFLLPHKDPFSDKSASEVLDIVKADLKNYKMLLDACIYYRHHVAILRLRIEVRKQLNIPTGEKIPYNISMKTPPSLIPLINEYKRLNKGK